MLLVQIGGLVWECMLWRCRCQSGLGTSRGMLNGVPLLVLLRDCVSCLQVNL